MKKFAICLLIVGLACAVTVSGCDDEPSGRAGVQADTKPADPMQKVTLRMVSWSSSTSLTLQRAVVDMYAKKHPTVELVFESVPEHYIEKLLVQMGGGDAPDIITVGDQQLAQFAEQGGLADLEPFITGPKGINTGDYFEHILKFGKYKNKLYTMPKDWSNMAILYNKKLFDEARIPYPKAGWTWDEFYETCKKLTVRKGNTTVQWGLKLPGTDLSKVQTEVSKLQPLLFAFSDGMISPDGKHYAGHMNSDGMLKALRFYRDTFYKDGVSPTIVDMEKQQGIDLFAAGKVAMSMDGRWLIKSYLNDNHLELGSVPLPIGPKGPANILFYAGWGIYSKSKHKEAAWDAVKFMSGPEGARIFADYGFSAHRLVAEEKGQMTDPYFKAFIDDMPNIKMGLQYIDPSYSKTALPLFQKVMESILRPGDIDIKQLLDEAAGAAETNLTKG